LARTTRILAFALAVVVLLFGVATSTLYYPRQVETVRITQTVTLRETVTVTQAMPTQTVFTGKQLVVRLGESFVITMDKQQIEVKPTRLHLEARIAKYPFINPAAGYRFAIIDLELRNLGNVEARADWWWYKDFELKVTSGYVYKSHYASDYFGLSLKPGTTVAGYICFEIPSDATPVEVYITPYEWAGLPQIIVKLS